ncbi:MAG: uracil-DNA glycosylase [Tepidisphaeraceae bacterium]
MALARSIEALGKRVVACERCPRLRAWCEQVAREKRAAYASETYWGRPVPGFGDPNARLWIVGLAPAAHGANRTGRIFTGDRSGDFLYASLHRLGYANQPTSVHRTDGLMLTDCYISATARCAPPDNKPTPGEVKNCSEYLDAELELLKQTRVMLALGGIAWDACIDLLKRRGRFTAREAKPKFAHGEELKIDERLTLLASYHVSQQNTFTGRLTPAMFDAVIARAKQLSV